MSPEAVGPIKFGGGICIGVGHIVGAPPALQLPPFSATEVALGLGAMLRGEGLPALPAIEVALGLGAILRGVDSRGLARGVTARGLAPMDISATSRFTSHGDGKLSRWPPDAMAAAFSKLGREHTLIATGETSPAAEHSRRALAYRESDCVSATSSQARSGPAGNGKVLSGGTKAGRGRSRCLVSLAACAKQALSVASTAAGR